MIRVLVLDNYDSFTYNLVQYLGELGVDPVVRRNDEITVAAIAGLNVGGVIISPGPCTPVEAGISVPLIRELSGKLPILGVCLGHQSIGAAFGAQVIRAPRIMHGKTSLILHDGRGVFAGIPNPFTATRYHSLCVEERGLPDCLEVSARVADETSASEVTGIRVPVGQEEATPRPVVYSPRAGEAIMGLRHREHPTEGVQFHPESILTESGHHLLKNFLAQFS